MLSPLWWLPLAVAGAAVVPLWRGSRRLMDEAARLQVAVAQLALVRPVVAQVQAEIAAVATVPAGERGVHDLGPR